MAENVLKSKNALIVGGTSGIGYAIALELLRVGAQVTVTGRTPPKERDLHFIPFDFDKAGLSVVEQPAFRASLDSCDILCVAYGPFVQKPLHETRPAEWEKIALADYALPGILTSNALQSMIVRKWGRILLFGGTRTDAVHGYRTNAAYAGAKTGVAVLVKSVAMQYSQYNITCNALFPGFTHDAPEGASIVKPSEIAQKALFLLNSTDLNGVLLSVDAGWNPC